jgi:DNA-binding MarR family transcriptional regulator
MKNNLDLEARLHGTAHSEHPQELRLWLRLLTCTQLIEKQIRTELRVQFDTTLPRFDLMAQLERNPDGLKMNDLSRRMMVSGGNVTGITDQLVTEELVERVSVDGDRRSYRIKLTDKGRTSFAEMAAQHESWIVQAFGGLKVAELAALHQLLGQVKQHVMSTIDIVKNTKKEGAL